MHEMFSFYDDLLVFVTEYYDILSRIIVFHLHTKGTNFLEGSRGLGTPLKILYLSGLCRDRTVR